MIYTHVRCFLILKGALVAGHGGDDCNPSTQEVEAGLIQGQPGLHKLVQGQPELHPT